MTHIEQRTDTAAALAAANPDDIHVGEAVHESDTGKWKIGDGDTPYNDLPYKGGVDSVAGKTGGVELVVADVAGAAPVASPVLTGTPKAPTRATSDDSTNIATTEYVKNVVDAAVEAATIAAITAVKLQLFPVGSIYTSESSTSPATFIGGTWVRYAKGRTLVSLDEDSVDIFNDIGEEGGAKTVTLTAAQSGLPAHNHSQNPHSHAVTDPGHQHGSGAYPAAVGGSAGAAAFTISTNTEFNFTGITINATTATNNAVAAASASQSHDNVQPYKTVYMWKRTA